MANPNLVNVTSIYGKSIQGALTTTVTTDLLTCATDKLGAASDLTYTISYEELDDA